MSLAILALISGSTMLLFGLVFILSSIYRRRHAVGHEYAQVEFIFLGVGMTCIGLLDFLLGLFYLIL
jgi:hypothetical protein